MLGDQDVLTALVNIGGGKFSRVPRLYSKGTDIIQLMEYRIYDGRT